MNGQADDPRLMKELAQTFMSAGIISSELGNAAEAHRALLRAKDILEDLLRVDPEAVGPRIQLARCYIELESAETTERVNPWSY